MAVVFFEQTWWIFPLLLVFKFFYSSFLPFIGI